MPANAGDTMQPLIPHRLDRAPAGLTGGVYAIGNFDGMHRGHAVLFEAAKREARARGVPAVALTFEPHPRTVFRPDQPIFRLTPLAAKARIMAALGLDGMIVVPFDRRFASHTAENFIEAELIGRLGLKAAVVGYDFHFGKGRAGSPEFLGAAGERLGFGVTVIPPVSDEEGAISSSRIRAHLEAGAVEAANRLLGYRWFVIGAVIAGDRRGRELGVPTANIRLDADCRLRHGIYAVKMRRADGSIHDGVASFGRRPTFDNGAPLLEVHLLDLSADLYGEVVAVTLIDWIRPELRFDGVEALVAAMREDIEKTRVRLAAEDSAGGRVSTLDAALDRTGQAGGGLPE